MKPLEGPVSIQFSEIHNLVRTYQRVLKLEALAGPTPAPTASEGEDRVSISREAHTLRQVTDKGRSHPNGHAAGL